ncbi:MAG: SLBB domain-containing protein [bacterium]
MIGWSEGARRPFARRGRLCVAVASMALGGFSPALAGEASDSAAVAAAVSNALAQSPPGSVPPAILEKIRSLPEDRLRELLPAASASSEAASGAAVSGASVDSTSTAPGPPTQRIERAPQEIKDESPEVGPSGGGSDDKLVPFGYGLFEGSPENYSQPALGPVDPEYPLGPGDTVILDVWGDTVFRVERSLDREGGINLPDVGRVVLAGLKLSDATSLLRRRLADVYSGLGGPENKATTHLAVTLGNLRVIRVFVVGRVRRPGGFDLSAASTVFHGLFYAGGPTREGSLRDIRLVRGGKEIAKLDVYAYLRTGKRDGDVRLENDDTIFIPARGPRMTVKGEVRTPGLYEMRDGETLKDLVETSGGLTETAFEGRIQVQRILTPAEQEGSKDDRKVFDRAWAQASDTPLKDGDIVTVFPITDRIRNFATISGEVRRPGTYELKDGDTVADLVRLAGGLLETAFLDRAELVRTHDDLSKEQLSVDVGKAVAGQPSYDLKLCGQDHLTVYSIWRLQDRHEVSVHGAVRSPGSYELRDRMTLRDLLLQAGGLLENAWTDEVEISRVRPEEGAEYRTAEIFHLPLGANYVSRSGDDFFLQPWDNVFVRWIPNYELQRNVIVTGEVRFPGMYTLRSPTERLSTLIDRAGGLISTAYPAGFSLVRKKDGLGRVALDLERALKHPGSDDDVILFAGDSLFVPEQPKTVTVRGQVGYPTSLIYQKGMSIGDYVDRAGGTTEKADRGQIRVVYSTGAAAQVKRFWFDPPVLPGSTIIVPEKEEKSGVAWGEVLRDSASILASLATAVLVVDKLGH